MVHTVHDRNRHRLGQKDPAGRTACPPVRGGRNLPRTIMVSLPDLIDENIDKKGRLGNRASRNLRGDGPALFYPRRSFLLSPFVLCHISDHISSSFPFAFEDRGSNPSILPLPPGRSRVHLPTRPPLVHSPFLCATSSRPFHRDRPGFVSVSKGHRFPFQTRFSFPIVPFSSLAHEGVGRATTSHVSISTCKRTSHVACDPFVATRREMADGWAPPRTTSQCSRLETKTGGPGSVPDVRWVTTRR